MTTTPEGVTDPLRALEVKQRVLESRLAIAESAVARVWVLLTSGLLVVGQLLSFLTYTDHDEEMTPSLLTFGLGALTYVDEDGHRDAFTVVLGVAFAGLSLLTIVALISLLGLARRAEPRNTSNVRVPIAVLLILGLVGAWLTVLLATSRGSERNPVHLHAGLPLFTAGVLVYAWLVISEAGRDLWVP